VLFVGRLVPKKGFDIIFDVRSEDRLILCIGEGTVPTHMQHEERVRFLGNKSQAELKEFYQLSDVFILPSYGEGFPLVIQEAMASGLPIITTDQKEYQSYLDNQFIELVPRDTDSFREALDRVFFDEDKYQKMSEYSRKAALEMFSWEDSVTRISEVYKKLQPKGSFARSSGMKEVFSNPFDTQMEREK
jgi:glycosyltransferase involved in cell wall biosynthesis